MIKNYVIDTNVMIHDPSFLYKFEDNNIIIPIVCIQELDNLKNKDGLVGYHARCAARELNNIRKLGDLHKGIKLKSGGTLRIELNYTDTSCLPDGLDTNLNDTKILAITKNLQRLNSELSTILVTKDLYMAIKGDALGIVTQDYQNDKIIADELYKGYEKISLPTEDIDRIYSGGLICPREFDFEVYPNQFFHIKSSTNMGHEIIARFDGEKIVPLKYVNEAAWGLYPLNMEQKMAFELLMDPEINFVSITGGAGSGKTILSAAVAIQRVIEQGLYRKIVFVRPVAPAGNDIGYLPGTENEKLRPWMGSFYDAIENIMDLKQRKENRLSKKPKKGVKEKQLEEVENTKFNISVEEFIEKFREEGAIETKTFTYMRGRTLTNSFVIVDEAQQTTPHLAKLMLTRAGFDSKFVFIGDPTDNQIDNILVDAKSNGLVYAVEKMKGFSITGHVTLGQVERSPLAKLAEKYM